MGLSDFATVKSNDAKNFPGPGQYASSTDFGKVRREHITFKGRYRETASNRGGKSIGTNEEVGPGKYNIDTPSGAPAFSMAPPHGPTSARITQESDLGPLYTPRQKQISSDPSGPQYSFGSKTRGSGAVISDTPGPNYDLPSTLAKSGVRIGGTPRRHGAAGSDGTPRGGAPPGPGAYSVPRFGDSVPKPKNIQLHKPQKVEGNGIPGPGEYLVDHYTIAAKTTPRGVPSSRCTLTGRHYPPLPSPCGEPGPAAYEIPSPIGKPVHGKSMGSKPVESSELDAIYPKPGPGDYDLPSSFSTNKGFSFGQRPTQFASKFATPGPGHVEVPQLSLAKMIEKDTHGIRFSARNKPFERPKDESAIDSVTGKKVPSWKPQHTDGPGPASYNPKATGKIAPSFSMTAREHKTTSLVERENVPGPGTYNYDKAEANNIKGPTFYKGSFADVRAGNDVPGPGQYDDREAFEKTKSARGSSFTVHPPPPLPGSMRRTPRVQY